MHPLFLLPVLGSQRPTLTPTSSLCPSFFSLDFLLQVDPEKRPMWTTLQVCVTQRDFYHAKRLTREGQPS